MATNTVTDLVVNQYIRQPVPQDPEGMAVYLSGQLQEIENSMKTVGEGSLQVVDKPPARPLKGMLRYAVTPWDPLGTGFQGLVVYSGNAWLRASDPEGLVSAVTTDLSDLSANLSTNYYTKVTADSAIAAATLDLVSTGTFTNTLGDYTNTATLNQNFYTKVTADAAIASATLNLVSTTDLTNELGDYTNTATLNQNFYTKTDADSAISSATLGLASTTDVNTALSAYTNTATLNQDFYTKTDADSAISTATTNLSTTVGNTYATITNTNASIDGIEAKHTVKIDNNGHISGYGLISTANNGTPTSTFDVAADAFRIGATDSGGIAVETVPFAHYANARTVDGVTMPAGTYIENLFVEGARIKSLNADVVNTGALDIDRLPGLSQLAALTSASQVELHTNNSEVTFQLTTGNLTAGSKLLIMASFSFSGSSASNHANGQAFFESTGLLTDSTNTWNRTLPAYSGTSSSIFTFNGFAAAVKNGSDGTANIKIRIKNTNFNNRTIRIPAGLEILVLAVEK